MKIGLLSDTHGHLDERILEHFSVCDEIWHAGDIGNMEVVDKLSSFKKFRAVYGNIDGPAIRLKFESELNFECENVNVFMTHIGAYPPKYNLSIREKLAFVNPDLFICGHSHIVRILKDKERGLLHINPGAAGKQGFHKVRTIMRFELGNAAISNLQLIELGKRV